MISNIQCNLYLIISDLFFELRCGVKRGLNEVIVRQSHASETEAVEQLIQYMPDIRRCHTVFSQLERQWTWIALTGKINSLPMR